MNVLERRAAIIYLVQTVPSELRTSDGPGKSAKTPFGFLVPHTYLVFGYGLERSERTPPETRILTRILDADIGAHLLRDPVPR